jgi:ribosomal protein S18 acetylase RimI-like enzyme
VGVDDKLNNKVIHSKGLSEKQLNEIRELADIVNKHDNISMKLNWDFLTSRPENEVQDFLYYENGHFVGYLAIYIFNKKEAEVSAMVHPEYRDQHIFHALLQASIIECKNRNLNELLFMCDHASKSGIGALKRLQTKYDFSEYLMDFNIEKLSTVHTNEITLRTATYEDIDTLVNIDRQCFKLPKDQLEGIIKGQFEQSAQLQFLAEKSNVPIGKICVLTNSTPTYIFGFAVFPEYQGRGYGSEILTKTIQLLIDQGMEDISLEVAVKNDNALQLYKKAGFVPRTTYDYYRLTI